MLTNSTPPDDSGCPDKLLYRNAYFSYVSKVGSPLDMQRQMGHTSLQKTNHYASLGIQHLRRSHEAYSPLRAKQDGSRSDGIGTGYWEEE